MRAVPGRTFAAVAFTLRAAAPHHRRLMAAVGRRVAVLRAASVDVTVIGRDSTITAELLVPGLVPAERAGPDDTSNCG